MPFTGRSTSSPTLRAWPGCSRSPRSSRRAGSSRPFPLLPSLGGGPHGDRQGNYRWRPRGRPGRDDPAHGERRRPAGCELRIRRDARPDQLKPRRGFVAAPTCCTSRRRGADHEPDRSRGRGLALASQFLAASRITCAPPGCLSTRRPGTPTWAAAPLTGPQASSKIYYV